jgi:hypothetical protein
MKQQDNTNKFAVTILYNHVGIKPDQEFESMSFAADQEMIEESLREYDTPMFKGSYRSHGNLRWNTDIHSDRNIIVDNIYQYLHDVTHHSDAEQDSYMHMQTKTVIQQIITMMYQFPKCKYRFDRQQTHGYVLCFDAIYRQYCPSYCFYIDGNRNRRPIEDWCAISYDLQVMGMTREYFGDEFKRYWNWLDSDQQREVQTLHQLTHAN